MLIEYVGHACFYLTTEKGVRIIIDPYDNSIGLKPVCKTADIVLVTHHHFDHDYLEGVSGDYEMIDKPGSYEVCGVRIVGTEIPHDHADGTKRGKVVAYKIVTDRLTFLHMGDVGIVPPERFYDWVGKVDVLMLPIGGTYTVNAEEALEIIDKLRPNIAIPMHYKTTHLTMDIDTPHNFIKLAKKAFDTSQLGGSKLEVSADEKKKRTRIIMMENSF